MGGLESRYCLEMLSSNLGMLEPWLVHYLPMLQFRAMPDNIPYEKLCYEYSTRLVHQFLNSIV
jgi:hypothetical protein